MTIFTFRAVESNGDETIVAFTLSEDATIDKAFEKFEGFMSAYAGYDVTENFAPRQPEVTEVFVAPFPTILGFMD